MTHSSSKGADRQNHREAGMEFEETGAYASPRQKCSKQSNFCMIPAGVACPEID